jgi:hypothetical protein
MKNEQIILTSQMNLILKLKSVLVSLGGIYLGGTNAIKMLNSEVGNIHANPKCLPQTSIYTKA